jgi:hypothetical protein
MSAGESLRAAPGERYVASERRVVHETLDGETVLVQLATGAYYSLRGSGAAAWERLAAGAAPAQVAADLAVLHGADEAQVLDDVLALVDRLLEEGLLEAASGAEPAGNGGPPPVSIAAGDWTAPTLEVFTDMKDFLLLDPLHDVGDPDWPRPQPGA